MKPEDFNAPAKQEPDTVATTTSKFRIGNGLAYVGIVAGGAMLILWPAMAPVALALGLYVDWQNNDLPRVVKTTTVKALPAPEAKPADPKP